MTMPPGDWTRQGTAGYPPRFRSALVPTEDPYLLRELLFCGQCDLPMVCSSVVRSGVRRRTYRCRTGCRHGYLWADALESQAWIGAERRATISDITPACRKSTLEILLIKVVADSTIDDLTYVWRT